jgi:nucleoside-diphosphate-sugar epimerase
LKRVLIAGCGFAGDATARLFEAAGWAVEGWTRRGLAEAPSGNRYPVHAVDIGDAGQVRAARGTFDVVIHSASTRGGDADAYRRVYLNGMQHLCERFAEAAFVFVSSTSVYAQDAGEWVTEESAAQPKHETGQVLREAESLVLEQGGTVARLAGLYGPGRSGLLQRILGGEAGVDPHHDRFVNQVHRDDVGRALFLLSKREDGRRGQIYNVTDDRPMRLSECYRWLGEKLQRPLNQAEVAQPSRKRGNSNKRVSNTKLRETGWQPAFPSFIEGMEKSVLPERNASFGQEAQDPERGASV